MEEYRQFILLALSGSFGFCVGGLSVAFVWNCTMRAEDKLKQAGKKGV